LARQPHFWRAALASLQTRHADQKFWEDIRRSEEDDTMFHILLEGENEFISAFLLDQLQNILSAQLSKVGMATLPYDGHISLVPPMIEKVNELSGHSPIGFSLESGEGMKDDVAAVLNFANERLILNEQPNAALLLDFADLTPSEWPSLSSGSGEQEHLFVTVRLASRTVEQYDFILQEGYLSPDYLKAKGRRAVCFVQRSGIVEGSRIVELVVVETLQDLLKLMHGLPHLKVITNISLAALSSEEWAGEWLETLEAQTHSTILFDLSPFHHLSLWHEQEGVQIRYGLIDLRDEQNRFPTFALLTENTSIMSIFLIPCSRMVANALNIHIKMLSRKREAKVFIQDDGFIHGSADMLIPTLTHLFRDESFFDFNAGRYLRR
jgi:hypothetical protein